MIGKEIYKIWIANNAKWTDWIRPVPFISLNKYRKYKEFYNFSIPNISYKNDLQKDTAIIVDLPGYYSINEGIALAKLGYRPIPIFNGTNEQDGSISTTNNRIIERALIWGASELKKIKLDKNSLPVFLLDTNRMNRYKIDDSIFDNSWDIYPQDIPSPEYLLKNGINKIIIRSQSMQKDLKKILYEFQQRNIKIFFTNGYEKPKEYKIKKTTKNK